MEPPWQAHPDIPAGSIGWRMGHGQDYLARFEEWFRGLSADEQQAYVRANRPSQAWRLDAAFGHPPWPRPSVFHRLLLVKTGTLLLVLIAVIVIVAVAITLVS